MKLRTAMLAGMLLLIASVVAATVVTVAVVVNRSAKRQVANDLLRSKLVFKDIHVYQQAQAENQARVLADEPRIRALLGSDVQRPTIIDVARRAQKRVGSALFILTDEEGFLIVDLADLKAEGGNMTENPVTGPVVKKALAGGRSSGMWTDDKQVYRVQANRIRARGRTAGVLLLGQAIADRDAETMHRQTGSIVALLLDGKPVALSALESGEVANRDEVAAAVGGANADSPSEVSIGGSHYLVLAGEFPGYRGKRKLTFVLMRDLDRALAPGRRILRLLFVVAGLGVLAAIILAMLLSRRLTRPLDQLVAFTRDIAAGKLERQTIAGPVEVKSLGESMNKMVLELDESRQHMAEKERLEQELDIASRIQTSILPRDLSIPHMEIAAAMIAADEVGGDYYDVHITDDGGWIAIGDVSGHGLDAGLIMLMAQTSVATLVAARPEATPSELVCQLNRVVFANVQERMEAERHMTLSILRVLDTGRVTIAGAHMDLIILRSGADACETIDPQGTWIGIVDDVSAVTRDTELELADGDLMVVYTDGLTEAMNEGDEQYGLERLCRAIEAQRQGSAQEIIDHVLADVKAWQSEQVDDITLLISRFQG